MYDFSDASSVFQLLKTFLDSIDKKRVSHQCGFAYESSDVRFLKNISHIDYMKMVSLQYDLSRDSLDLLLARKTLNTVHMNMASPLHGFSYASPGCQL